MRKAEGKRNDTRNRIPAVAFLCRFASPRADIAIAQILGA